MLNLIFMEFNSKIIYFLYIFYQINSWYFIPGFCGIPYLDFKIKYLNDLKILNNIFTHINVTY
jgi:hypothetical protein